MNLLSHTINEFQKHYLFEEYNINSIYIEREINNISEAVLFFQHIEDNL